MKVNKISKPSSGRRLALVIIALALITVTVVAIRAAYSRLHAQWLARCVLTDVNEQVIITSGSMVKADAIREAFGLVNGANLATIDYEEKRDETIARNPIIKSIAIERILPDKVAISVVEREPAVRIGLKGMTRDAGKVTDFEGVVFSCRRGTGMLPMIRESAAPGTPVGGKLTNRGLAALKLLQVAPDPEFAALGILEVDISRSDYLVATLGNYSRAKIAWEGMDEGGKLAEKALRVQLANLVSAIKSGVSNETRVWNATLPGKIFCDNQGVN